MVTTTLVFSAQARSIRLRWPACNAPMVGTRPIVPPSRCHRRDITRIFCGESTTTGALSGSVLDLFACRLGLRGGPVARVRVLGPGKGSVANVLGELLSRSRDLVREVRVPLHELGRLPDGEAEDVVKHQDLTVG